MNREWELDIEARRKEIEMLEYHTENNTTHKHMLSNYLYGKQFIDIEKRMMNAVTQQELDDIWDMNKSWINLMKSSKSEYLLYDMLYWHKKNLTSLFQMNIYKRKKNVSAKTKATKGSQTVS